MALPDKRKVLDALLQQLAERAAHTTELANTTRRDATHAEAKPENDKDTRALEQSYLARGQALRVEELLEQLQVLRFMPLRSFAAGDPLAAGALAFLESDQDTRCVFLAPHGGGAELRIDEVQVLVVTPQSPLGALVLGRALGDEFELRVRGTARSYQVVDVA